MTTFFRKALLTSAILCAATSFSSAATAASKDVAPELRVISAQERDDVISLLEKKTGLKASAVAASPLVGFDELTVGTNIYYVDRQGKWLIDGNLVDMNTRTSVTGQKRSLLQSASEKTMPKLDWKTLNLADAVKTVHGGAIPGRVIVTFEDPNCPVCKHLYAELQKVQNLTVYTFPVSILGQDSQTKNEALWCAKDRSAAWGAAMTGQVVKGEAQCDTTGLARNGELAAKMRVQGTPTLYLADGTRIPGFMDASALEGKLAAVQK